MRLWLPQRGFGFPVLAGLMLLLTLGPARAAEWESISLFASGEARVAVQEAMRSTGATAVSVALVDGDRFPWTETYGYKDLTGAGALAASGETLFGMGPASRLVTAIAVLQLAERGRVRLDDPVVAHLPAFRMRAPEFRRITVRMLLSQASGLPGTDRRNLHTSMPYPGYPGQVLAALAEQQLKHPPGYMHSCGQDGYTVLEALVAAVSGDSYARYVQKEILDPLGMSRTRFPDTSFPDHLCARGFRGRERLPREYTNSAAAGLYSTPEDMAKLITMLVNGGMVKEVHILDRASIQDMGRDQTRGSFDPVPCALASFGLGWDTVNHPSLRAANFQAWSIQGQTPQFGTAILVLPSERMGVIVTGAGFTAADAAGVAERVLLRRLVERKSLAEMPRAEAPWAGAAAEAPEDLLPLVFGLYAGCDAAYRARAGTLHDTLHLETFRPAEWRWRTLAGDLRLRQDGWFVSDQEPGVGYRFETADARQYLARRWTTRFSGVQALIAQRVDPAAGIAPGWRALIGRTWLLANELPSSQAPAAERSLELMTLPGADRLLFVHGQGFYPVDAARDGPRAGMLLLIPGFGGGDLDELCRSSAGEPVGLRSGSRFYRL